jgi:glycosyltransferase involved in cell wall biosynthesis
MRLLFVAHGHPAFHPGGGELVAYSLYQALRQAGQDVFYIGVVYPELLPDTATWDTLALDPRDPNDLALRGGAFDFFTGRGDPRVLETLGRLFERIAPNLIHFHHFVTVGIEALRVARNRLPSCKTVLTLHEYWAICPLNGQMVRADGSLCDQASLHQCARCLPERSFDQFFLREQWFKCFFAPIQRIICPSRFLLERYRTWGLPAEKLIYLANGIASQEVNRPFFADQEVMSAQHRRFGFFGQLTPFKGVELLLQAGQSLNEQGVEFEFGIHGTLNLQASERQTQLQAAFTEAKDYARWYGAYTPDETQSLMVGYDWIIIPSTWWENAPLVVEEALAARKPILCSDIGGLREKVVDGRDGLHFRANDAFSLAQAIARAATDAELWERLHSTLRPPTALTDCLSEHLALYRSLVKESVAR